MIGNLRTHIKVWGVVQGVFFRATAKEVADRLGLKGQVQNMRDGSVEIIIEGTAGQAADFLKQIQESNPIVHIEKIEYKELSPQTHSSFEIKRRL